MKQIGTGPDDLAVIEALWIGELKPDLFSAIIQLVLSIHTDSKIKFSHNAFVFKYTGMVWHATTDDDPRFCGVCEQPYDDVVKGSAVRARKEICLGVTNAEFSAWLESERGKKYSNRQNIASILPFVKPFVRNGDIARNCSEFLAKAASHSAMYSTKFLDFDFVLPTDTFRVIIEGR